MPPPMGEPPRNKIPAPKNLKEVPSYLVKLIGSFFQRFGYIVKLVWDTGHWILFLMSFVALFKGVVPVITALISKSILNELQTTLTAGPQPANEFWSSPIFFLLIFLFTHRVLLQIVNHVSRALNRIAGEKVIMQVKLQIMQKSKTLDLASFDNSEFYERMENASREAGIRPLTIISETFNAISTVIEFVSYLIVLFAAPGLTWATLVIIAVCIPSAVINFIYRRKNFQYMRFRSKDRREMDYYSGLLVNKDMIKEVRMFDLADTFIGRFLSVFDNYFKGLRKLILAENIWHIVISVVSAITNLAFYILIALQVFTGQIMIGDYTLYTGAIAAVATCITALINSSGTIYEGTLFIDNLILFMKERQTVVPSKTPGVELSQGVGHTIEFENVSFRYPGTEKDVLHNISFTIPAGQTLALVGLNGAGKTTLIKLLTRLYDPSEGRILLDGRDIKEYDLQSLYSAFGIIFQDFGKYAVSVEENIRFGDVHRKADMAAVQNAAEQSSAAAYIDKLPDGYQTPLMRIFEKNGMELSIGQWQKLAIARAFYADSDILILDEPTASLDAIAEQEVFSQFDRLRADKTTIFVSHRLSSATVANHIIVLENGCLIEEGTHRELMDQQGKYFTLFSTQAKRYLEEQNNPRPERPERPEHPGRPDGPPRRRRPPEYL